MKTRELPALWKTSSGSPYQLPQCHFHIHHRQNHCLDEQRKLPTETSDTSLRTRHFFSKTILDFHLGALVPGAAHTSLAFRLLSLAPVSRSSAEIYQKQETKPEQFFLLSLCILYSLPWNLLQKRNLYPFIYTGLQSKTLIFMLWKVINKKLESYPIQTSCKIDKFLCNLILL